MWTWSSMCACIWSEGNNLFTLPVARPVLKGKFHNTREEMPDYYLILTISNYLSKINIFSSGEPYMCNNKRWSWMCFDHIDVLLVLAATLEIYLKILIPWWHDDLVISTGTSQWEGLVINSRVGPMGLICMFTPYLHECLSYIYTAIFVDSKLPLQ